jgi:hypothetical protein
VRFRHVFAAVIALALAVAGCSSDVVESTTTTTLAASATTTTLAASATTSTVDKSSVVQEYLDRRSDGRIVESLQLTTPEVSEEYLVRQKGLAAWNFWSEQVTPCRESPPGTFTCVMSGYTDFHTIGGMGPWTNRTVVKVNDEGIIYSVSNDLLEWTEVSRFNGEFQTWLESAHPEEAARMSGTVMTSSFTEDDALIALRFVEEFVASQSEG